MDLELLKEKIGEVWRKIPHSYYLPLGILLIGLICLSIGMMQLFTPKEDSSFDGTVQNAIQQTPAAPIKQNILEVDVEGGVVSPGLYSLPYGSRIKDALIAAGGLSAEADRNAVAKQLNLAVKVSDGGKIYIPKMGDPSASSGQVSVENGSTNSLVLGTTTGLVNINSASAEELDNLPGIGQVTAQKIINGRPYDSVEDLLTKKIVGNAVYQKIKDKISVY